MQNGSPNIYLVIIGAMLFSLLLGGAVIAFYIRYYRRLTEQQEKSKALAIQHQKDMLHATIRSQEEERRRIGQDLHDDVGSVLSRLRMLFNKQRPLLAPDAEVSESKKMNSLIDKAIDNTRNISHRLSPVTLEFFGLEEAMQELCDTSTHSSGISIRMDNRSGEQLSRLSYPASLHLFRVFEELISNSLRHAGAGNISITLSNEEDHCVCTYQDDGRGFDTLVIKKGIGLYNIDSRIAMINGRHVINSTPGNGVTVHISIPYTSNQTNGKSQDSHSR